MMGTVLLLVVCIAFVLHILADVEAKDRLEEEQRQDVQKNFGCSPKVEV